MRETPTIVFFSKSNEIFEIVPEECFSKWRFHLIASERPQVNLSTIENISLVIVDTYSLGISFLEEVMSTDIGRKVPVIVLDDYEEPVLVDELLNRGIKGYLLVHAFASELESTIEGLLAGQNYKTNLLLD
ncbi:MAG: hypothetical protein AAFN93_19500 [Bacteroidota bacterium]